MSATSVHPTVPCPEASSTGVSSTVSLREQDCVKLILEFLSSRQLNIAQLSLERETGVINEVFGDDLLFLRQLIIEGQWDDVLEFVQPLNALADFDRRRFYFEILKIKYLELLCIKSEAPVSGENMDAAIEQVVSVLNDLEQYCVSKEEYSSLCLLLTLPRLSDHSNFSQWNPCAARMACFRAVLPLVQRFLPSSHANAQGTIKNDQNSVDRREQGKNEACDDRLVQLIIKGLLYESCVQYCHRRATTESSINSTENGGDIHFGDVLSSGGLSDSDLSLLSWLQSIPSETFNCPFEQRSLNVQVEQLSKPRLSAVWTEHMLVTPIKPETFPHSAMSFSRPRSAEIMSRSLHPHLDGLLLGLTQRISANNTSAFSVSNDRLPASTASRNKNSGFHLIGKKTMDTSVDRLFENSESVVVSGENSAPFVPSAGQSSTSQLSTIREEQDSRRAAVPTVDALPKSRTPIDSVSLCKNGGAPDHSAVKYSENRLYDEYMMARGNPPAAARSRAHEPIYYSAMEPATSHLHVSGDVQRVCGDFRSSAQLQHRPTGTPDGFYNSSKSRSSHQPVPDAISNQPPYTTPVINTASTAVPISSVAALRPTTATVQPSQLPPVHGHPNAVYEYLQDKTVLQGVDDGSEGGSGRSRFIAVSALEDVQAVRCAEFHPGGKVYAVGSNSKTLRVCAYPKLTELRHNHETQQPSVLYKRSRHHKGSIYCLAWSPAGDLIATGSNDKTIKLMSFNCDDNSVEGGENEVTMHDGTIRDLCFIEDMSNRSSVLVSGGAGDCRVWVTDCETASPFQSLSGHTGHVLCLYTWGGAVFVSGSQDRTIRFWDLRTRDCVNVVHPGGSGGGGRGAPVASVAVDPSGRLLVSGHEDSLCSLYDIRGDRFIQTFRGHQSDVRSVRFSPSAFYLLTAGYDGRLRLTDMQGDLTAPLQSVTVGQHADKVISGRWHPHEFSFISTSADKTCTLWALPSI